MIRARENRWIPLFLSASQHSFYAMVSNNAVTTAVSRPIMRRLIFLFAEANWHMDGAIIPPDAGHQHLIS